MSILDNKYAMYKYFKEETTDSGVVEFDLSSLNFNLFKTDRDVKLYQLDKFEAGRPDLLSFNIYGTTSYWWILSKYNDIINPIYELQAGLIIKVPHEKDIQEFAKNYGKYLK
jgi:hypothetical protein